MGRGVPIPDDKIREFAVAWLETGVIATAARRVGIPTRSACDLARRLEKKPWFARRRRDLFSRAMARAEVTLLSALEVCAARMRKPIEKFEGPAGTTVHDRGAEYARALTDIIRTLQAHRKMIFDRKMRREEFERGTNGGVNITGPVEITVKTADGASDQLDIDAPADVGAPATPVEG